MDNISLFGGEVGVLVARDRIRSHDKEATSTQINIGNLTTTMTAYCFKYLCRPDCLDTREYERAVSNEDKVELTMLLPLHRSLY